MIPTLLYLLFKKWRADHSSLSTLKVPTMARIATVLFGLLLVSLALKAQKQVRHYKIMRHNSVIGWANVERQTDSNRTKISMESDVKVSFILSYESTATEVSDFRDGQLEHSYYYRKTNGNIKANRHMYRVGSRYEVGDSPEKVRLDVSPVTYNTLCMYFFEPVGIKQVYSDNHQRMLDIEKMSDGGYRITSGDGTSNTFYYTRGVCYKIKIDHSFYSAVLLLN